MKKLLSIVLCILFSASVLLLVSCQKKEETPAPPAAGYGEKAEEAVGGYGEKAEESVGGYGEKPKEAVGGYGK